MGWDGQGRGAGVPEVGSSKSSITDASVDEGVLMQEWDALYDDNEDKKKQLYE